MRWAPVLFLVFIACAESASAGETQYDGHWFDQSRAHGFDKNGRRILTDGRPDRPELKAEFKPVPPIANAAEAPANAVMSDKEKKDRAKNPHLYWDYDKTLIAAGAAFAFAAIGFLLAGPFGAIVGFLGGLLLGAIASNLAKPGQKPPLAAKSASA